MDNGAETESNTNRRVIKRYSNRKLYDTRDSRYVTLLQIAEMVRAGEDVQIIDNTTKEDKTEVTLALAISEELKAKPRSVPLGTLRNLIQERGEKLLTSLREGAIGRLIPSGGGEAKDKEGDGTTSTDAAVEQPAPTVEAEAAPKHDQPRLSLVEIVASGRATLEQWQHAVDDRVKALLPGTEIAELRAEVRRLTERVEQLERLTGVKTETAEGEPEA